MLRGEWKRGFFNNQISCVIFSSSVSVTLFKSWFFWSFLFSTFLVVSLFVSRILIDLMFVSVALRRFLSSPSFSFFTAGLYYSEHGALILNFSVFLLIHSSLHISIFFSSFHHLSVFQTEPLPLTEAHLSVYLCDQNHAKRLTRLLMSRTSDPLLCLSAACWFCLGDGDGARTDILSPPLSVLSVSVSLVLQFLLLHFAAVGSGNPSEESPVSRLDVYMPIKTPNRWFNVC